VTRCLFVSDLHGRPERYAKLWRAIESERPAAVFLGGDLLAALRGVSPDGEGHGIDTLEADLDALARRLGAGYPRVFVVLGNDDPRAGEPALEALDAAGRIVYAHARRCELGSFTVYGYACVPPTPFALKDWERYDVSRFVDPGCVAPEEGRYSVPLGGHEPAPATIRVELERLAGADDLGRAVFLFHGPPYRTCLDRASLDGASVEHAPLDVHVGSIAVRRFIETRQPWLTLHGHVHESARLSGAWRERIGRTWLLGAAHDGPELCLVRFELERPEGATRELV
jgi:Icc-related predicted phosphoesterase